MLQQFKEILSRYLSDHSSASEKREVERWLQKLEEHSMSVDDTGEFDHVRDRIYESLERQLVLTPLKEKISISWSAIAASITFLVAATSLYFFRYAILDVIDPITWNKINSSRFEIHRVILPDSSIAILNAGSSIQYPEQFRGHRREIILDGQAFFDVKKNPSHPFYIQSKALEVQVLGTSFVVTDFGKDAAIGVAVRTGRVSVSSSGVVLKELVPFQDLWYNQSTNRFDFRNEVEVDISWTKNQFSFHDTKLSDVFDSIESRYRLVVNANKPELLSKRFTGSFEQSSNPEKILEIISLSFGWEVHKKGNTYTISSVSREK
jgi:ferric-dicitrate binding protein FerR (iron transport regulator)